MSGLRLFGPVLAALLLAGAARAQEEAPPAPVDPALQERREVYAAQQAYDGARYSEAVRVLRAVHARGGGDGASHALLGHSLFALDRRAEARAELVEALARGRVTPDVVLRLAEIDRAEGDLLLVLEELRLARVLAPDDDTLPVAAADVAAESGLLVEAERDYERALRARPGAGDTWLRLGNLHVRAGRNDEALIAYRVARALGARGVTRLIAELHLARGDAAQAASLYESLLLEQPEDAGLHLRCAELLLAAGDAERACVHAREVLHGEAGPLAPRAHILLGRALSAGGDAVGALREWERALEAGADSPDLDALLGMHFHRTAEHAKAVSHLRRCLAAEGPDFERQVALTESLLALSDLGGAREALVGLIEEFGPENRIEGLVRRLADASAGRGS